jgi:hypothetical protein
VPQVRQRVPGLKTMGATPPRLHLLDRQIGLWIAKTFNRIGFVSGHGSKGCRKTHVLYQGTTLVGPLEIENMSGFSPWGTFSTELLRRLGRTQGKKIPDNLRLCPSLGNGC